MKKLLHLTFTLVFTLIGLLPLAQANEVTYFIPDVSGSPVAAMNEAGDTIWRKHYTPFGAEIETTSDNRISYTGHVKDQNTGLLYMGQRYYDPVVPQFMSMDPAAINPEDPRTFNRYTYANNNPYLYLDPDGRAPKTMQKTLPGLDCFECGVGGHLGGGGGGGRSLFKPSPSRETNSATKTLQTNKEAGKAGEALTRAKLGDKIAGEQVTFKTSDGTRTRPDFVTTNQGIVETKTGNANLSPGQVKLKADIDAGIPVTPVGANAKAAGLEPGKPTIMNSCTVDRC